MAHCLPELYFNPVGAHDSGLIGEDPNDIPNNLMPYIAQVASGKLPHLSIFESDYDTKDGTGVREYVHVMDLAEGHRAALRFLAQHTGCQAINLSTGTGHRVLKMVKAFEVVSGQSIPCQIVPRRSGDIVGFQTTTGSKMKKKALITGITGQNGAYLAELLLGPVHPNRKWRSPSSAGEARLV